MEVKDLNRHELQEVMAPLGGKAIHVQRMMKAVYRQQIQHLSLMDLQVKVRDAFSSCFQNSLLTAQDLIKSEDGSAKLKIPIEKRFIESVYLPIRTRSTVCVSSQVGCSLDCKFCLTAKLTLMRNLKPWEIVDQVLLVNRLFPKTPVTNVVFMGMGEPFYNYDNVKKTVDILTDAWGLGLGKSKITVSTSGHIPGILNWAKEGKTSLAVSLITADVDLRSDLMSINKKYPLKDLIVAMKEYSAITKRKIFVEYILMKGLTDSISAAKKLAELLKDMNVTVNLIPYNENSYLDYKRPGNDTIFEFRDEVKRHGIFTTIRWSYGGDVLAACGQLSAA